MSCFARVNAQLKGQLPAVVVVDDQALTRDVNVGLMMRFVGTGDFCVGHMGHGSIWCCDVYMVDF